MDQLDSVKEAKSIQEFLRNLDQEGSIRLIENKLRAWRTAGREEVIRFIKEMYPPEQNEGMFAQVGHMVRGCRDNVLEAVRRKFPTPSDPKPNPPCEIARRAAKIWYQHTCLTKTCKLLNLLICVVVLLAGHHIAIFGESGRVSEETELREMIPVENITIGDYTPTPHSSCSVQKGFHGWLGCWASFATDRYLHSCRRSNNSLAYASSRAMGRHGKESYVVIRQPRKERGDPSCPNSGSFARINDNKLNAWRFADNKFVCGNILYGYPCALVEAISFNGCIRGILGRLNRGLGGIGLYSSNSQLLASISFGNDRIAYALFDSSRRIAGLYIHFLPLKERNHGVGDYGPQRHQLGNAPLRITLTALVIIFLEMGCQGWIKLDADLRRSHFALLIVGILGFTISVAVLFETFSDRYQGIGNLTDAISNVLKEDAKLGVNLAHWILRK